MYKTLTIKARRACVFGFLSYAEPSMKKGPQIEADDPLADFDSIDIDGDAQTYAKGESKPTEPYTTHPEGTAEWEQDIRERIRSIPGIGFWIKSVDGWTDDALAAVAVKVKYQGKSLVPTPTDIATVRQKLWEGSCGHGNGNVDSLMRAAIKNIVTTMLAAQSVEGQKCSKKGDQQSARLYAWMRTKGEEAMRVYHQIPSEKGRKPKRAN